MPNCKPTASASPANGAHEGKWASATPAQEAATDHSRHGYGIAPNLLQRVFEADRPNTIWLADITYIATDEGWLYLAAVKDMATREIVGWSMADHLRSSLCENALMMAIQHRAPPRGLIHHSDRGVQYARIARSLTATASRRP